MRSTRAIELALVAGAIALVGSAGCRGALDAPIPAAHPGDETPRRGGTLRLASFQDIASLDPAQGSDALSASAIRLVYAGLVDFDAQGNVVPDLAKRVDVSSDGLTYRFTLPDQARFQDGAVIGAADIKRSIERALAPATASPLASFYESIDGFAAYAEKRAPHLDGVVVEGERAVAIHLSQPDATFLSALAMTALRPVCPSVDDAAFKPCGAGPFMVPDGGWQRGLELRLARSDHYFMPGLPYLDGIRWELGVNVVTEGFKFARGELDVVRDLTQADTIRYQTDDRWRPLGEYEPARSVSGDAMNAEIPPFDNVEVRRAVASAIDRDHLALLKSSNLTAVGRPVPAGLAGYAGVVKAQTYDLDAAREHMRKAGLPNGWPAPIPYSVYAKSLPEMAAQVVQQDLAKIGLHLEMHATSYPTFLAITRRRGKAAMSPQGQTEDFPDPSDFLEHLFTKDGISDENTNNYGFYVNGSLDALLARARRSTDPAERARLYADAEQIVCDDAPWAFEYAYRFFHLHQPYVRGYRAHPVWAEDVSRVWIDRDSSAARALGAVLP